MRGDMAWRELGAGRWALKGFVLALTFFLFASSGRMGCVRMDRYMGNMVGWEDYIISWVLKWPTLPSSPLFSRTFLPEGSGENLEWDITGPRLSYSLDEDLNHELSLSANICELLRYNYYQRHLLPFPRLID